ncbi:MFS transporter [Bifidobacterium pullorum]|nr:MFS transporter [Bifidobacterium pullorum]
MEPIAAAPEPEAAPETPDIPAADMAAVTTDTEPAAATDVAPAPADTMTQETPTEALPRPADAEPASAQPTIVIPTTADAAAPPDATTLPATDMAQPDQPGMPGQPAQPAQPGQPGMPGQAGAPVMPGAPAAPKPNPELEQLGADLKDGRTWQTIGVSLGLGMAAAVVAAIISAAALTAVFAQAGSSLMSSVPGMGTLSGVLGSVESSAPNFLQLIVIMLTLTSAGSLSVAASAEGFGQDASTSMEFSLGLGLAGAALFAGAAFGAFWFARRHAMRWRWTGVASAVIVGALGGVAYLVLALIGRATLSAGMYGMGASAVLSGATFGTFFSAFLASGLGAAAGCFLASAAPDGSNVFMSFWRWLHRARGFVRTVVEAALVYAALYTVLLLVVLIILAAQSHQATVVLLLPVLFPWMGTWIMAMTCFGGITMRAGSDSVLTMSLFSPNMASQWALWVGVLLFLVATCYVALRLSARAMYDPSKGGWQNSWKSPLTAGVAWLVFTGLFCGMRASYGGSSSAADVRPALWTCLVVALWMFIVEVVANTFGPHLVAPMWKIVAGGCVQPPLAWAAQPAQAQAQPAAGTPAAAAPVPDGAQGAAAPPAQPSQQPTQLFTAPTQPAQPTQPIQPTMAMAVPPAAVPHQPMKASTKRGLIIGGAVAGVVALLAILWGVLGATVFSPKTAVQEYLEAIAGGRWSQATKLVNPQTTDKESKLLDDAAAKDGATISNPEVTKVSIDGGSATAQIRYVLGGKQYTGSLTVASNGPKFLVFKDWGVVTPLTSTLTVSAPDEVTGVSINGVDLDKTNAAGGESTGSSFSWTFKVYPGAYQVTATKSKYYTAESQKAQAATIADGVSVDLRAKPTDALTQAIGDQVKSKLDTCAESTEAEPEGCPFSTYRWSDEYYRNYSWSITKYPKVTDVDLSGSFSASSGTAKVTYDRKNWDDTWEPDSDEDSFECYGTYTIDGNKVTVDLNSSYY